MKKFILLTFITVLFAAKISAQYSYHSFTYGGLVRTYLLYIPHGYDSTQPAPFVLVLHGLGDTISNFKGINMNQVADTATAHFVFAMPQAVSDPLFGAAWNSGAGEFGYYPNSSVDDVGFLNALIDTVSAKYNIDQTRLFSTGFSMGGFMTNRLGCELNNRIAAIASVSGTIGSGITCNPTRAIPAAHFHGTLDTTVGYYNDQFGLNAEALVAYWMHHNHTDTVAASIDTFPNIRNDGKVVVHYIYPNGNYGTQVEFFQVIGGYHEWLTSANDINYSVEIWRFFMRYQWLPQTNGINPVEPDLDITVRPNPAQGIVYIQIPQTGNAQDLKITDATGRIVYSNSSIVAGSQVTVNTSGFNSGMYIITTNVSGRRLCKKLLIAE